MKRIVFFVLGAARSGKTTFGRALATALDGVYRDCSGVVMREYTSLTGAVVPAEQKEEFRSALDQLRDLMMLHNKGRVAELVFRDHRQDQRPLVIGGIEREDEFRDAVAVAEAARYIVYSICIVRPDHTVEDDRFELDPMTAGNVIFNNESIAELRLNAHEYAENLRAFEVAK